MNNRRRPLAVLAMLAALAFGVVIGFMAGSASAAIPQPARTRIVTVTPPSMPSFQQPVPVVSGNG